MKPNASSLNSAAAEYLALSPKGREIFHAIHAAGDDWISTRTLCEYLYQRRLTGSDQRHLTRLARANLISIDQTRAYLVDGTLTYLTAREARARLHHQHRMNIYRTTRAGHALGNAIAAAAPPDDPRSWWEDTRFTLAMIWKSVRA